MASFRIYDARKRRIRHPGYTVRPSLAGGRCQSALGLRSCWHLSCFFGSWSSNVARPIWPHLVTFFQYEVPWATSRLVHAGQLIDRAAWRAPGPHETAVLLPTCAPRRLIIVSRQAKSRSAPATAATADVRRIIVA